MALTETVQVYENNLVRRIVGVKRADKRRMDELGVEVGVKESFKKKLVRSRLTRADHVERTGDENTGKENRCTESKKEARKTEIAM